MLNPVNPPPAAALRAGAPASPGMLPPCHPIQPRLFHGTGDLAVRRCKGWQTRDIRFKNPKNPEVLRWKVQKNLINSRMRGCYGKGVPGPTESQTHRAGGGKVTWLLQSEYSYFLLSQQCQRGFERLCPSSAARIQFWGSLRIFLCPESMGLGQHLRNT